MGTPADERGRQEDLEFLDKVRTATYEELLILQGNHSKRSAFPWKVKAIERAIARSMARDKDAPKDAPEVTPCRAETSRYPSTD